MHAPPPLKRQAPTQNPSHPKRLIGWMIVVLVFVTGMPRSIAAESAFVLETPIVAENIHVTTFDKKGRAVGASVFEVETDETGALHLSVTMAIEGGGRNVSEAILVPVGPERTFRILEERSQATRADGISLDYLVIDHAKRRVSCYPPDRDLTQGQHVELPEDDRVVNVSMQLLFQPLVSGEVKDLRFQIALCRDGPVLYKMVAVRGPTTHNADRDVLEVRYGPDLGNAVAWFASRLLPRFSFWFDTRDGSYLGHRMPLHRKGPKILLVRQGLTPSDLGFD